MPTKGRGSPNIILIMADDMGYGDFGCFSEGRCHTPAIDRLIAALDRWFEQVEADRQQVREQNLVSV